MTEKLICMIVNTTTMSVATVILFVRLSEFRFDRKKSIWAVSLFTALTTSFIMITAGLNDCNKNTTLVLLAGTLPSMIFFWFVSKYRGVRFFTTYCIADVSIALVDFFFYLFTLWAFDGNFTVTWVLRSSAMVLWSIVLYYFVGNRYRRALELIQKGWFLMMSCVVGMYVVMSMVSTYPTPIAQRPADLPLSMIIIAMMALTIIIVIRSIYNALEVQEHEQQTQYLHAQLSMAENQYALISENIDQIRKQRHDLKYHLNVMKGLIEMHDYDELQRYLDSFQSEKILSDQVLPVYTRNQAVNILAGYYAGRAEEEGIRTVFSISLPSSLSISRAHLTVLLGNLWQNALEACQELPKESDRFIETSIALKQNRFMIHSVNSASGLQKDENGKLISTKGPDRGRGLASMENIVRLYDGFYEYDSDQNTFTFSAVLPLKQGGEQ